MFRHLFIAALAFAGVGFSAYVGWSAFGAPGLAIAIVASAPLLGLALAAPIVAITGRSVALIRELAYRDLEGRHFEYKGVPIDVREDLTGARWLRLDDVRKLLPMLPRLATLQRAMPDGLATMESSRIVRISAAALDAYLQKSTAPATLRLRVWLQRTVIFPSGHADSRFKGTTGDPTLDGDAP